MFLCSKCFWQKFSFSQFGSLYCLPNPQQGFLNSYFLFLWFFPTPPQEPLPSRSSWFCSLVRLEARLWASSKPICSAGPTCPCWIPQMLQGEFCIFLLQSKLKLSCWSGRNVAGLNEGFPNRFPTCKILIFSSFLLSNQTRGGDRGGSEGQQIPVCNRTGYFTDNLSPSNTNPSLPSGTIPHTCH